MPGPFDGLKVVDLTTVVVGPYSTQLLSDMGATVTKVEAPDGDMTRLTGPMRNEGMTPTFMQKELTSHMLQLPEPEPLADVRLPQFDRLPRGFEKRWPEASHELLAASQPALSTLSIDHSVKPAAFPGGVSRGRSRNERCSGER